MSRGKKNEATIALHLLCPDDAAGVNLVPLLLEDLGHAEVGDLRVHLVVEQHVAGVEVPVDHLEARVLVEVQHAAGDAQDDALPHLPVQLTALPGV
jgi:hypothetical protein